MARYHWALLALILASAVAARVLWSTAPVPAPLAFQSITDDQFQRLRRQAIQFVEARPRQGFRFVERKQDASFQVQCRGVPVLWVERLPRHLLMWPSLDAGQRAPDVLELRALLQWQLEPVAYLEQLMAGVSEPVLLDRVLLAIADDVTGHARCDGWR